MRLLRDCFRNACLVAAYVYAGLHFGFGSLVAVLLRVIPAGPRREAVGRRLITALTKSFTWFMEFSGVIQADFSALQPLAGRRGLIVAANHPSLLDALFLLAKIPGSFCVAKGALMRNPFVGPMAHTAGYVGNDSTAQLFKQCVRRVQAGETMVIFPEGTRTRQAPLGPLQLGCALVACRAGAPIQTVLIDAALTFCGRGPRDTFFPPMPTPYVFRLGPEIQPKPEDSPREVSALLAEALRANLSQ